MDFITDFVKNNAPLVLKTAIAIAQAFVKAAPEIAKAIYPMIPQIMDMIVEGVMDFIPVWIETAKTMFGLLADAIPDLWKGVKDASATAFKEWKTNIFDRARDAFGEIWDHIKDKVAPVGKKIGDAVGGAFKGAVNAVLDHIEERLNAIPNAINGAIDLLNALPGVNISPMDSITLPRLAKGGIVSKATLAQIGENGREAVIPLERNKAGLREIARLLQSEMKGAAGSGAPGASGKQNQGVVINMTQNNTSPKSLSAYEIWRQSKNMATLIKLQLQGV
jgi:phage-related protein